MQIRLPSSHPTPQNFRANFGTNVCCSSFELPLRSITKYLSLLSLFTYPYYSSLNSFLLYSKRKSYESTWLRTFMCLDQKQRWVVLHAMINKSVKIYEVFTSYTFLSVKLAISYTIKGLLNWRFCFVLNK